MIFRVCLRLAWPDYSLAWPDRYIFTGRLSLSVKAPVWPDQYHTYELTSGMPHLTQLYLAV